MRKHFCNLAIVFFFTAANAGENGPFDYYNRHVENSFVKENIFRNKSYAAKQLPTFEASRDYLPQPFWESHATAIDCYWKTWQIAFSNLRQPEKNSGFVANFIDTAFNDHIFMWDSVFMLFFGFYGTRAFNFQQTLDNFYAAQHSDGYICREIRESDGAERFDRYDPSSTGPNLLPWVEWEYYLHFEDNERLAAVFPVLTAYNQWFKKYRTWPDGTYFASGWGTGMDNQPRLPEGYSPEFDHGHMSWVDRTLQQIFIDKILLNMADILDRRDEIKDTAEEIEYLTGFVNQKMWNRQIAFYVDRYRDGSLSDVKSIGAYWALLAQIVPPERMPLLCAHLENPDEFNRYHRIPSLSADHPGYQIDGGYWRGGVWPLTNYIVLRGLTQCGFDSLAHVIALNHHSTVVRIFQRTGTLWENYAPESDSLPPNSRPNFVGFTGLSSISIFFEYILGIRSDVPNRQIIWNIRLLDKHGIRHYPFGKDGWVDLNCEKRTDDRQEPIVTVSANIPITVVIKWQDNLKAIPINGE